MNLKFEDLFRLSINQVKENWKLLIKNGAIISLITFGVMLICIVIFGLPVGIIVNSLESTKPILPIPIMYGAMIFLYLVLFSILAFMRLISDYVIAMSSFPGGANIWDNLRNVVNFRMYKYVTIHVYLPIIVIISIASLPMLLIQIDSVIVDVIKFIVFSAVLVIPVVYFQSKFILALLVNPDVKRGAEMIKRYKSSEIILAYIKIIITTWVLYMIASLIVIIPLLGIIALFFILFATRGVVYQVMYLSLKEEVIEAMYTSTYTAPSSDDGSNHNIFES